MPLDDREQRILAEIERRFYEEDPAFAEAVRNVERPARFGVRWSLVGLVLGIALVLVTFTVNLPVATVGFVLMVVSATALVRAFRLRGGFRREVPSGTSPRSRRRPGRRG